MTAQALDMPLDIPWLRLAFSTDMVETKIDDNGLPPKWRSSMAIYAYVVPHEDTQEQYPDRRVVYLKLTTSITGWCPREDLLNEIDLGPAPDPHQASGWQAIMGTDWASRYWACRGAIAQLAVYPNPATGVGLADYPYIVDFEPKKRELYEAVSQTGEVLSDSSNKIGTQKGTTTTNSTEEQVSAGISVGPIAAGGSLTHTSTDQTVDNRTTDTSTESRETQSHTTQFSQMYQLFNGYHLGTNRAVFIVFPRPHTDSSAAQIPQNLISGERLLEGIQEMFLVISMPRSTPGFCVKAWLDTSHAVPASEIQSTQRAMVWSGTTRQPNGGPPDSNPPGRSGGSGTGGASSRDDIVITRRWAGGCAQFNGDVLVPSPLPSPPSRSPGTIVSGVFTYDVPTSVATLRNSGAPQARDARTQLANDLNAVQAMTRTAMLEAFSSGIYPPTPFVRSTALWALLPRVLRTVDVDLDDLVAHGYLTADQRKVLHKARIDTTADVFAAEDNGTLDATAAKIAGELRDKLLKGMWHLVKKAVVSTSPSH